MVRHTSFGFCAFCGERKAKPNMPVHLKSCLETHARNGPLAWVMLLRMTESPGRMYWLDVIAPSDSALQRLDTLLRAVWMECCGHASLFLVRGGREIPKSRVVRQVFGSVGDTIRYEYD